MLSAGLCVVVVLAAISRVQASPTPDVACGASAESRWSASSGAGYSPTQVYGTEKNDWLVGANGIAAVSGRLFVYDAAEARVHVLNDSMRKLSSFGRRGDGPGELAIPRVFLDRSSYLSHNLVTVDDSLLYVYDGRGIQSYGHDGTYRQTLASVRAGLGAYTLLRMHASRHGLFFAYDSLNLRGSDRRLQSWRVSHGGEPVLVHDAKLIAPRISGLAASYSDQDARPIWAMYGTCLIWGDGSSLTVERRDLASGRSVTFNLPNHSVARRETDPKTLKKLAERMGVPVPETSGPGPIWRWANAVVDPDGHVWVNPWSATGRPQGHVLRIDPAGKIHREEMVEFPAAFGPPGVFYSISRNVATREVTITRYERKP